MSEWRAVADFPGYEVSDLGEVRSWKKSGPGSGCRTVPLVLAQRVDIKGYLHVGLSRGSKPRSAPVHRLVARAFLGPCPEGLQIRHGVGGKLDNRVVNLCYGTGAENSADRRRDGTGNGGERNGRTKLTAIQVAEIRAIYTAGGVTPRVLGERYGVAQTTIRYIVAGETWR